jgi:hypothetical protein
MYCRFCLTILEHVDVTNQVEQLMILLDIKIITSSERMPLHEHFTQLSVVTIIHKLTKQNEKDYEKKFSLLQCFVCIIPEHLRANMRDERSARKITKINIIILSVVPLRQFFLTHQTQLDWHCDDSSTADVATNDQTLLPLLQCIQQSRTSRTK